MNLHSLFTSPVAALPITWTGASFAQAIADALDRYLSALSKVDPKCSLSRRIVDTETLEFVEDLSSAINTGVRESAALNSSLAYAAVCEALEIAAGCPALISRPVDGHALGPLYRMQQVATGTELNRARLFHAPDHLSHLVKSHRFGIAGKPCLYLGGSLEVCLLECGLTDADPSTVAIAQFMLKDKLNILDFGYRPSAIAMPAGGRQLTSKPHPDLDELIVEYARCWPLIAACTVRRSSSVADAIEYRFPQLVLRWLLDARKCHGVRYFSSRVSPDSSDLKRSMNVVFPATDFDADGYSTTLRSAFELTEPQLWRPGNQNGLTAPALCPDWIAKEAMLQGLPRASF